MKNRFIPFGYKIENGEIVRNLVEAETVKQIFQLYCAGKPYSAKAAEMSESGYEYHHGSARWDKPMLMRILENTRYKGENDYPAIVTPALYDADQTVRASKRREVSRKVVATPTQTFTAPDYSPTSAIRRLENEINRAIDRAVSADVIKKLIFECASLKYESLNK